MFENVKVGDEVALLRERGFGNTKRMTPIRIAKVSRVTARLFFIDGSRGVTNGIRKDNGRTVARELYSFWVPAKDEHRKALANERAFRKKQEAQSLEYEAREDVRIVRRLAGIFASEKEDRVIEKVGIQKLRMIEAIIDSFGTLDALLTGR